MTRLIVPAPEPDRKCRPDTRGFSLLEMVIVLTLIGLITAIGASNFRGFSNDLNNGVSEFSGYVSQVRARAMNTTSAYRIRVISSTELRAETARSCSASDDDWEEDTRLTLRLRDRVELTVDDAGDDFLTCFSARGIGSASPTVTLRDNDGNERILDLFLGGAVVERTEEEDEQ